MDYRSIILAYIAGCRKTLGDQISRDDADEETAATKLRIYKQLRLGAEYATDKAIETHLELGGLVIDRSHLN